MKKLLFVLLSLFSFGWALAVVNINTASEQELQTLTGIGPAKAKAIVAHRQSNGAFKSAEQITEVKGIGTGIYNKIKADITVSGGGAAKQTPPATPKPATKAKSTSSQ